MNDLDRPPVPLVDALIDRLPLGICVIDADRKVCRWNKTLGHWTGLPPQQAIGSNLFALYPHLESRRFSPRIDRVFESREPALFSPSSVHPFFPARQDSDLKPMLQRVIVEPVGEDHQFAQIIVADVTAHYDQVQRLRKEKEQHLISQQLSHAILETAVDSIITITSEGLIETFNTAAERCFGYSEKEVLGKNISMLMPPPYSAEHDGYLSRYLQTGEANVLGVGREVVGRRKDGSVLPLWLSVSEVSHRSRESGESPRLFTGILRDLTEQKKREAELVEAKRKAEDHSAFGKILEQSLYEIYIFESDSLRFLHVNRGAQENIGFDVNELQRMTPLDINPNFARGSFENLLAPLRDNSQEHIQFSTVHQRKDGTEYPVEVRLQMSHFSGQDAFIAVVTDTVEQQRIEQELRDSRERALAADRAKSEFLANMSHEIRTPMTAILGFTDVLLGNLEKPENIEAAQTVKANGAYLIELINDILDLSKVEAGKLSVELIECSPVAIIEDVVSLMSVRSKAKGLDLKVRLDGGIPQTINSDPTRIRQILINIVGNAIKFTETGSVEIVCRLLDSDKRESKLQFDVVDTGIGIPQESLEKLFQPFTQADTSTTRKFGGTGLGLTICKRLVELLGGSITVKSEEGQGTTFSFTVLTGPLPSVPLVETIDQPDTSTADQDDYEIDDTPLNRRILVVEDKPFNQKLLTTFLQNAGAEVSVAENGKLGVEEIQNAQKSGNEYDAVVMDMQLPVMDGYSATKTLRADGFEKPIIAITAHAMSRDREKCLNAGCTEYTTKPINQQRLVDLIRNLTHDSESPKTCSTPTEPQQTPNTQLQGKILLVEDGPDNQRLIEFILQKAGAEVVVAENGQVGLDAALTAWKTDEPFGLILMDIQMPVMDGKEATQQLREAGYDGQIVALTAHSMPSEIEECLAIGCDCYCAKPIDRPKFLAEVAQRIGQRSAFQSTASSDNEKSQ